ncbi:MAG TPA: SOS response-associated peptidase [Balneolaceae bacterium]|nr:SOS response-associated peptidase [Balneolaceae bacterium]
MCGRYVLKANVNELSEAYLAEPEEGLFFEPIYNVAPTTEMPVIFRKGSERIIDRFRWGLIPFWAKDQNPKYSMINARQETITEKKSYSKPFISQRCIVPANGFYEWRKEENGKQPYYITFTDKTFMSFAGIYERWQGEGGKKINSFTIITTDANKTVSNLHDRMPAILHEEEFSFWLDPANNDTKALKEILLPYEDNGIEYYPVSKKVNSPRNQEKELIEPV